MIKIGNSWDDILEEEVNKEYFTNIIKIIREERTLYKVFPEESNIFNAFRLTDYKDVKVVILGQDPYHGFGQANGLAFSVQRDIKIPPSLKNIYLELESDLGISTPKHGDLSSWAEAGILLLNTALTVRESTPNSHSKIGWSIFTDKVIKILNNHDKPIVFLLWGNNARMKKTLITNNKHLILEAPHPSPFSVHKGFFGCKHFSKANDFLSKHNRALNWNISV